MFSRLFSHKSKGTIITLIGLISSWMESAAAVVDAQLNRDVYTLPDGVLLTDGQQFDYIVVGAGAGGAVAASRLALAGHHVLLLEAGGDPGVLTKVPAASLALMGTDLDWRYKTLPNNVSCLSSVGKQCRFSRGKCLGGSTSINHLHYLRGNRVDYDEITSPGWSYDDLLPYFLRYEGLQDLNRLPKSSKPYHNTTGPMRIGFFNKSQNPWYSKLIKGFRSLHFPFNPDVNAESQIGVSKILGYVYKGERMSTARGFLARDDVKRRLTVAKYTTCTGVIINNNNIAEGVTAIQGFRTLRLYVRKEVILSAGTIGTPQILMLSGIGPANHLKNMGIPVKVDIPVGAGMTDHVLTIFILQVQQKWGPLGKIELLTSKIPQFIELLFANKGELTSNGLGDIDVFANTHCYDFKQRKLLNESSNGSDCKVPNLQVIHAYIDRDLVSLVKMFFKQQTGFNDEVIDQLSEPNKDYGFIVLSPVLLSPQSVGNVQLASRDPLEHPAIYPNYLGDRRDVDEIVRSIGILEQLIETPLFVKLNISLLRLEWPDCPHFEDNKQGYWQCYVRHMTYSGQHAAGTAALGRVLDTKLRVLGVQRLRVADLSALPRVPRSNTAAVSLAIGERVVDFLHEDNK